VAEPFLRWAGSKRKLLPLLTRYWNSRYKRYVEPFAGSACFFFAVAPEKAILGDLNSDLIFAFSQLRDNLPAVMRELNRHRKSKSRYLAFRAADPFNLSNAARAARFIYLNRYAFNGIYRTNEQGRFNVPYGGWRAGGMPGKDIFAACSRLLRSAELLASPYDWTLSKVQRGDFVYMDPPYSVSKRRVFRQYDSVTFGPDDVERLKDWMHRLDKRGASFLVSYADSREGRFLAHGYECRKTAVRRHIAGFTASRGRSYELLISN